MALMTSLSSAEDVVLGSQRPRICNIPDYVTSAGDEVVALAERAGLFLDDWQQFVLRESLGERVDGKWAAPTVGLVVGRQNGKGPHSLDTPILTTNGWTTFADIQAGQSVYGADGQPTRVVARSPVYPDEKCYEVSFTDGATLTVGEGHLWRVWDKSGHDPVAWKASRRRGCWRVMSTAAIAATRWGWQREDNGRNEYRYRVRCDAVPQTPPAELPIDPYVFGLWLGDGKSTAPELTVHESDAPFVRRELLAAGYLISRETAHQHNADTLQIAFRRGRKWSHAGVLSDLRNLAVLNDKHIPDVYLTASPEQRIALLQGMMDTDGSITSSNRSPQVEFSSSYPRIAHDFQRLARSLGVRVTPKSRTTTRRDNWRFLWTPTFNPFRIPRKAERFGAPVSQRHTTMSITGLREVATVPVRCIQVEREDGVYLVGHYFTPTHNSILEARELAGLFLFGEELIVHTAHRQKIATNHFRRLWKLIKDAPEFMAKVEGASKGKGSEAIVLRDGRRIEFTTRQSGNARGLTADLLVYDEAMFLTESDRNSIAPTMAARSMSGSVQTVYAGSAVDQMDAAQDGLPFAKVREAAMAGSSSVAYFEWSAPGDDPSRVPDEIAADPAIWAMGNPGFGVRISAEWIEQERTVEMGPRGFAVERLGIGDWPDTSMDSGRVVSREAWNACAEYDRKNRIIGRPTFAVDTDLDQTWGSIAVAGRRADGLLQVAVQDHKRSADWIIDRCELLHTSHPDAQFVLDKRGPASNFLDDLKSLGVPVVELTTQDYGDACADFVADVVAGQLRYPSPQGDLEDALAAARKQSLGDRWKWGRKASTGADISPLVAVTLARWGVGVTDPPRDDWHMF